MPRNVRFIVAYDGTEYHGWQRQPGMRTIQGLLEESARRVLQRPVQVVGSGRTDAGVHACGQVAHMLTESALPAMSLLRAIGGRLPKDISLVDARDVPLGFNASRSAVSKLYRYRVYARRSRPSEELLQRFTYHFWHPLDLDGLREAAQSLVGEHDFAAFASKGSVRETTVRRVIRLSIHRHGWQVRFDVEGTGFLYNQVRNMVGTLLEVGRGHWPPQLVREILESRDRTKAGPTAPARGLCLQWVRYDLPGVPDELPARQQTVSPSAAPGDEEVPDG
jgi:tRNA pseudouridine38-40 synthase